MKTKYPRMFGLLAAVLLVASFVVPASLMSPAPVEAGVCKWDTLEMPGSIVARFDVTGPGSAMGGAIGGSEINKIAVGNDGRTIIAAVDVAAYVPYGPTVNPILLTSGLMGLYWSTTPYANLRASTGVGTYTANVFDVAIAPDNPAFWAVVTGHTNKQPEEVWITENSGGKWERTKLFDATAASTKTVGAIDISVDYGGKRDIAVGMRKGDGTAALDIWVLQSKGFTGWVRQTNLPSTVTLGDVFALKFSPTYSSDASLAVVFTSKATPTGTYYNVALRDVDLNTISQWAFTPSVEVAGTVGNSPIAANLISADLELPSDFSGQAASLRRAYISTDATTGGKDDGIFRIDDLSVYVLMNTTATADKRIASIAYFGTFASGKLLAGEVRGSTCTATVPTWFTDSPTTCPIPCWYPALKPATGAAGGTTCDIATMGDGNAQVAWFMDGKLALAATGASVRAATPTWWTGFYATPIINDESAFSISRNNGETWNQLALINTTLTKFNDFAISADCKTLYLASASENLTYPCMAFDSVWRSSLSSDVVSPLMVLPPLGGWYERVYTRPTAVSCNETHSDKPLLRVVPGCAEPTGQIIAWAAQTTKAQAWSPDYGDYWANITPRDNIQDFAFESSTVLYNLTASGLVQKMPYTGTAWSTVEPSVNTAIGYAHMITAMPEGQVLVGAAPGATYPVAVSRNAGATFSLLLQPLFGAVNLHVAFDPAYKSNNIIYVANDAADATGSVYRNNAAAASRWADFDMMAATNGAIGCNAPHPLGQYGLALAYTGGALYSAHAVIAGTPYCDRQIPLIDDPGCGNSGVCRTISDGTVLGKDYGPLSGMPKPGIAWDCLITGLPAAGAANRGVTFIREPYSLKLCGCCTLDTNTQLYALDARNYVASTRVGFLWNFADCMAKKGPALITADKTLIGCDPVSGRAQEVNLCWEQLCVADRYDIEIAKSNAFTIRIIDWVSEANCGGFEPSDVTQPCAFFPSGGRADYYEGSAIALYGNLECGHTYYWRVKARECATGQWIRSPWSEARSFTIKAGLPVSTPYYGVQLLSPNNGGLGIPVKPVSFSWSPFKETTKYKFVLAKDAAMTQVVKEADLATTAFEYDGALEYSANYFWRVMAVEPAPSDWSATFSFLTEAAPPVAPGPAPAPPTPLWVWVVIAIGAILVIVTLVLIFKTRRV